MVRTSQGGSILGFVIVGVVLALLLAGGVYAVRHQIDIASNAPVAPVKPESSSKQSQNKNGANNHENKPATKQNQPSASNQPAPQPQTKQPSSQTNQPSPSPTAGSSPAAGAPSPSPATQLPKTGSAGLISSVVALGLLSVMATAYLRSRRRSLPL